jgi:hypothetical protein
VTEYVRLFLGRNGTAEEHPAQAKRRWLPQT